MRCSVLALDYDGTIAQGGVFDHEVQQAIHEARTRGVTALVTGRILCPCPVVLRPRREGGAWALSATVLMLGDSHYAA
jgi:hydroxymethylpyrimidine pyrophosphatase-like HAD family hydrolase